MEAVERLAEAGASVIVGSGLPAVSVGAQTAAEALGVLFWEMTEAIDGGGAWTFSPRPTDAQLGAQTASFAAMHYAGEDGELRVALVYDGSPRSQQIAAAVKRALPQPPAIDYEYDEYIENGYALAARIREAGIDAVIVSALDVDGYHLWTMLREADANIGAWMHVGSQGYLRRLCDDLQNVDGFISVGVSGGVSDAYRDSLGDIPRLYRRQYVRAYGSDPTPAADLAASGVYLLLHYVLPAVDGAYTPEAVRTAALSLTAGEIGLIGEGLALQPDGTNSAAAAVFRQQQGGQFCTVAPASIATCLVPPMSFPTWRERAVQDETRGFICEPVT
jgi:hypothetical protein